MKKETLTRERIFEVIQIGNETDVASRTFDFAIVGLIIVNIVLVICQTFEELQTYERFFHALEGITVFCFLIELALRLWTADLLYQNGRLSPPVRYLLSFNGVVEVLSIIPFYMPLVFPTGIVAFRIFRVVRILRLFQANAYSDAMTTILIVLQRKRSQLLSSMMMIFVIMLMASLVMYSFEHEAQPGVFHNAFSGIWWAASTLLTVGYGDIYPITLMGKTTSIVITFLGVGMVAIPTGILSAGFTEYMSEQREERGKQGDFLYCPSCGKSYPR